MHKAKPDVNEISGVSFSEREIDGLLDFAWEHAGLVGTRDMRPAQVLKRLKVIRSSAAKILKHSGGDSLDAQLIQNELVSDTLQEELQWLVDEVKGFEEAFERFAQAEPAHRPRDAGLDHFVTEVRARWIAAGGNGVGSFYSSHNGDYDGGLLRLVSALLEFGECRNLPSTSKIHSTITHVEKHPYQGVTLKKR